MAETETSTILDSNLKDTEAARRYLDVGKKAEERGDREGAIKSYEAAYTADPDDSEICFRLAYNLDLAGNEDEALNLYELCVQAPQPPLNALLNLAILYEDRGMYAQAERCIRQVLDTNPTHPRARLYFKDIIAAKSMVVDEPMIAAGGAPQAMLDTPVTDFDLSVRARNALRKMNIRTLGDLLRVTEAELRGFKNFGETTLQEIKAMLAQKGLHLGQAVEQAQSAVKQQVYDQLKKATGGNDAVLNKPVADLELSVRARKALQLLNINSLGDLCMRTEAELMGVKNFGVTSLTEIKAKLEENGLSLRQLEG